NGDRRLDPGESADLVLRLANHGNATATAVSARLSLHTPVPGVSTGVAFVSFPDATPGGVVERPGAPHLRLILAPSLSCGTVLPLDLELSDASGRKVTHSLALTVGHPSGGRIKPTLDGGAGDHLGAAVAAAGDVDGDGGE